MLFKVDGMVIYFTKLITMIILRRKTYSLGATRFVAGLRKPFMPSMKAKRGAIELQNKALGKMAQTKTALENAALNPGGMVDNFVEAGIKNPIATGSQVAGKALMVAPVPTVLKAAPIGAGGTAAEVALKKWSPSYKNITEKLANKYHGQTKFRNGIQKAVNGVVKAGKLAIV